MGKNKDYWKYKIFLLSIRPSNDSLKKIAVVSFPMDLHKLAKIYLFIIIMVIFMIHNNIYDYIIELPVSSFSLSLGGAIFCCCDDDEWNRTSHTPTELEFADESYCISWKPENLHTVIPENYGFNRLLAYAYVLWWWKQIIGNIALPNVC